MSHEAQAATSGPMIGQSLARGEDERFLTGRGQFIDDVKLPGALHAVVVRSAEAHALNRGFTAHALLSAALHGEMVAFGAIVQLIAQEESADFVQEHAAFTQSLGLPVCFADLGAPAVGQAEVLQIAELSCKAPYIGHLRPPATIQRVADALWQADALGRRLQRRLKPSTAG